ncbi:MAG: hypothetical protein LC791_16145 [Acidobacteria bacterium]|nr:hypothetical protein [Acidobacteriota bacterium]
MVLDGDDATALDSDRPGRQHPALAVHRDDRAIGDDEGAVTWCLACARAREHEEQGEQQVSELARPFPVRRLAPVSLAVHASTLAVHVARRSGESTNLADPPPQGHRPTGALTD